MTACILTIGAPKRIGFISTRFHGTDGVTLEARKWAHILSGMGHSCFWMAGLLDAPTETSHAAPQWLTMDAAVKHCTEGIGIWQWASNDQGLAPDVVRA